MYKVPFIKPKFPSSDEIQEDYRAIVDSNWFTNFGPYEKKLRGEITNYIGGSTEVCTTSNATLALDVAMKALFKHDPVKNKVLIPSFTFAAGGNVILMNNFQPVFIDINQEWQPDIQQAKTYLKLHGNEVAGILLCNIFGVGNSEIATWEDLSKEYDLPLMVDSAAGFGSIYPDGKKLGHRGDCEIFSLHATKPFSVGEGGLITSKDKKLIEKCRSLTNFGFGENRKVELLGTNAKLSEMSCAIGIRQLSNLSKRLDSRRKSLALYRHDLEPVGYVFQPNSDLSTIAFVSVLAPTADVAHKALDLLHSEGVESKQYYDPLHRQPLFASYIDSEQSLRTTNDVADRMLCLPLHDDMSPEVISKITSIILSYRA